MDRSLASFNFILEDCRVLIQGITGVEAAAVAKHMLQYGTRVVAGVSPGKGGRTVESVPVYDSVGEAVEQHRPNVSLIYVSAPFVRDACLEAVEAGMPLVLIVTERVPQKDIMEIIARAQSKGSRIVGPNTVGLIKPSRRLKLGPIGGDRPERIFSEGNVSIISRSGGMSAETSWMLKREGLGVSLNIAIGGDPILGTTMKEMLQILEHDPETGAAVLFCEPGGAMEEEVAEFVRGGEFKKPVVAYVAGRFTEELPRGVKFGHAGAMIQSNAGLPSTKMEALKDAGVHVAERYSQIPKILEHLV